MHQQKPGAGSLSVVVAVLAAMTAITTDHPEALIAAVAAGQDGLFTREQAFAAGFTLHQVRCRVGRGEWVRADQGVYLIAGTPRTRRQHLRAVVLGSRGGASHRGAAWLQDLISVVPARPEVTVEPTRNYRNPAAIVHRQRDLVEDDFIVVHGIRCTNPYETLLSLGAVVPAALLERALDRGLRYGLLNYDHLVAHYFRKAKQGRDGAGKLRELFCVYDPEMPPAESDLETLLLRVIRESHLPMPERQVEVQLGDRTVRFDLAYPSVKVCIEGDGFGIHTLRGVFESDRTRQNAVVLAGWLPPRFTWRQIVHDPRYIVRTIDQALTQRGFFGDSRA